MRPPSPWARCCTAVTLAALLVAACGPATAGQPTATRTSPPAGGAPKASSQAAAAPTNSAFFNSIQALPVQVGPTASMTPPPGYLPTTTFRTATFPSAQDGWVGGSTGTSSCTAANPHATGGVIEATTDAGSSWSVQYQGGDAVLALASAGAEAGWALAVPAEAVPSCSRPLPAQYPGQVLLATSNGGQRWDVVDPRADGLDSLYFNAGGGWAGSTTCGSGGAAACSGALLHSVDAGRRWQTVAGADPGTLPVIAVTGAGQDLWALEAGPTGSQGGAPTGVARVVRSSDGGATWSAAGPLPLAQPGQTAGAVGSLVFASGTQGWATIWATSSCAMAGCATDAVFATTDGGQHWLPVTAGQPRCNVARPLVAASNGTVVVSRGVNLAACAGPQTTVLRQAVGGSTWTTAATWPTFAPVVLLGTAGGGGAPVFWALGRQALLRSTDGGAHWRQVLPAPLPTTAIQFLTPADGWGVGTLSDPGAILRTTDAGHTWSVVYTVPGAALSGISFASSSAGWVAGATQPWDPQSGAGLLWHTADGGRTWSAVHSGLPLPPLPSIAFSSATHGMLISPGSQIVCAASCSTDLLATTDGGTQWHSVGTVLHPDALSAVDITPTQTVWGIWSTAGSCNLVLAHGGPAAASWTASGCFAGYTGSPALQFVSAHSALLVMLQVLRPAAAGQAAVTRPVLLRTNDGAQTFQGTPLPVAAGFFGNHLSFLNPRQGWLLAGGALWATSDGGTSWSGVAA